MFVMIRAGSLYFALFISFIVTVILGSLIMYIYYSNKYTDIQIVKDQLESNADAGITLALYDTALFSIGNVVFPDIYNDEDSMDNIILSKSAWGIYQIIKSTAHWKSFMVSHIALAGADLSSAEPVALYLADKERYLSLSGNTFLSGNCYAPKVGLRTAYIEGQNYTRDKLVYGEIKTSMSDLPGLQADLIAANMTYFRDTIPPEDSLIGVEEIMHLDSLSRSFSKSTLIIYSAKSITLNGIALRGNIRILSSKAIYVTSNTKADNIILYAPEIYFDDGFRGNLQAFAQDSLVAGEDCIFDYPSCLGLINENINGIYLELKENTNLTGCVFLFQENRASNEPYLKLRENTRVHGLVYCPGRVDFNGVIEGSLYCNAFMMKTTSGLFENHLLNVTVDRSALSEYYAGSFLFQRYQHGKHIQWLN